MYSQKRFTNGASGPAFVAVNVSAAFDYRGRVAAMYSVGGTVNLTDANQAEAQRMLRWINETFIGQSLTFFHGHSGTMPASSASTPTTNVFCITGSPDPLTPEARARRFALCDWKSRPLPASMMARLLLFRPKRTRLLMKTGVSCELTYF